MAASALVVEDNLSIRRLLGGHLRDVHIDVSEAADFASAMGFARRRQFDIAIVDISLPDGSGLDICRALRQQQEYTPVIMLTARDADADRVLGLELGADDYVTKPFSITELIARVRAQLRRTEAQSQSTRANAFASEPITIDDLHIDPLQRRVQVKNVDVTLTAREFDLLVFLARHPGRVFPRAQLLDHVWGIGFDGFDHTVNSHINRLRTKIELNPARPQYVKTVWGVGYAFRGTG